MSDPLDAVLKNLSEHIDALVPSQDANSQINGVCVPQRRYGRGTGRSVTAHQNFLLFVRQDGTYIPVIAALANDYTGLVARDLPVLGDAGFTITLRYEWPGYAPYEYQLRTHDWRIDPPRITLAKLAYEVSKSIKQFVERMEIQNIAPEHRAWQIGPGGIQLKDLRLAALEQVSAGSYQPRLFWKPQA